MRPGHLVVMQTVVKLMMCRGGPINMTPVSRLTASEKIFTESINSLFKDVNRLEEPFQ